MFVDADAHVDECEETWSFLPPSLVHLAPKTLEFSEGEIPDFLRPQIHGSSGSGYYRFWFIDGRLAPRRIRDDERTGTTRETRELVDVKARLTDMDTLGIETQVLFPTLFLHEVSQRPDVCVALFKSYNRWLADRCAASGGRLRFVAMIPYLSMADALEEIRFAKQAGAAGLFKLGIDEGRAAADPYFFPAYELAAELDLPLAIHSGTSFVAIHSALTQFPAPTDGQLAVLSAFSSLLRAKVYERIPRLRVGFIEASSAWLPYLFKLAGWRFDVPVGDRRHVLSETRFYVACETGEDIAYLLDVAGGDDNFVVGTDYTHGDHYAVIDAHRKIAEQSDIDEKSAHKITSDNARALYGL